MRNCNQKLPISYAPQNSPDEKVLICQELGFRWHYESVRHTLMLIHLLTCDKNARRKPFLSSSLCVVVICTFLWVCALRYMQLLYYRQAQILDPSSSSPSLFVQKIEGEKGATLRVRGRQCKIPKERKSMCHNSMQYENLIYVMPLHAPTYSVCMHMLSHETLKLIRRIKLNDPTWVMWQGYILARHSQV